LQRIRSIDGGQTIGDDVNVQRSGKLVHYDDIAKRALAWARNAAREVCSRMGPFGKRCLEFSA
jgi:hypothetical protein